MMSNHTTQPPHKEAFRFLLLGKTGCGKSTTGNTILGDDMFDSDVSFESVTSECHLKRTVTNGRLVEILDSPGLFDTSKPHEEVSALVMQAIACMHPGPDAVFYVMKIGRYTDEEYGVYTRLKALLDENVTKYLIVLFTHGDALKNKKMSEMLSKAPPKLQEVLRDCGWRYAVMDNVNKPPQQVEDLLQAVKDLRQRNGRPYECPRYAHIGAKMDEEVGRRMAEVEKKEVENKKHVQELNQRLEKTKEEAIKEKKAFEKKEQERQKAIAAQQKETNDKLAKLAEELQQKQASEAEQRQAMEALRRELQEKEARQRQELEKQRQEEMRKLQEMNAQKEQFMKELMAKKDAESKQLQQMYEMQMSQLKDQIASMDAKSSGGCTIL